jgi:hypothetical protein
MAIKRKAELTPDDSKTDDIADSPSKPSENKSNGVRWTKEEVDFLIQLRKEGLKFEYSFYKHLSDNT